MTDILLKILRLLLLNAFILMGLKVMGIPHSLFEEKLEGLKAAKGVTLDTDLTATDLKELVAQYKKVYYEAKGEQFPTGVKKFLTILSLEHTIQA